MATTVVQEYDLGAVASATSRTLVMNAANSRALTNGNNLIVWVIQTAAAARTYSISDGTNTYDVSTIPQYSGATTRQLLIGFAENITGGDKTITVSHGGSAVNFTCGVFEVSGLKSSGSYGTHGTNEETVSTATHQMAAAGDIDTSGAGIIVGIGCPNASWGTVTKNANYTDGSSSAVHLMQYRVVASATNDQDGEYTVGTSRTSINVIAYFQEAVAASSGSRGNLLLMGFGN